MGNDDEIRSLEQLLDRINSACQEQGKVSLGAVTETIGARSFGPILLLSGLITLSPIGDIPGTPTLMASLVLIVSLQLLAGRKSFWLPGWLLRRSVKEDNLSKTVRWLRRPARFIDRYLNPRMAYLTKGPGLYAVALTCLLIALAMPPMELVPFTATGAGLALTSFGLALTADDGLVAMIAFTITLATLVFVFQGLK